MMLIPICKLVYRVATWYHMYSFLFFPYITKGYRSNRNYTYETVNLLVQKVHSVRLAEGAADLVPLREHTWQRRNERVM